MATYYWVGGTGTWNNALTTNWSLTSNGAGGAGVPTLNDNVIIDTFSGTGTISCTNASATCLNLTITATQASTLSGTISLLYGNLTLPSSGSFTVSVALTFVGPATGRTITTNNKTSSLTWTFNNTGDITISGNVASSINHIAGTLNLGSGTYTGGFTAGNGTGPAILNMNSAYLSLAGAGPWACNPTNYTINPGTSTIDMYQNAGTFAGGGKSYYIVKLSNVQSGTITISGANTFSTLNIYGPTDAGTGKFVSFAADQTIGSLTTTSSLGTARVIYQSSVVGTQRTLIVSSITTPNTDYKDIVIAGAASPYTAPFGVNNLGNNAGIVFNTQTAYWIGGTGNWNDGTKWSLTSGGSAANGAPGATNSVVIDTSSGTGTITGGTASCNDLTVTASQAITLSGALNVYGSLAFPSGGSFAFTNSGLVFRATTTGKTITDNGKIQGNVTFNGLEGEWTLTTSLGTANFVTLYLEAGTFRTGNFNITLAGGTSIYLSGSSNTATATRAMYLGSSTLTTIGGSSAIQSSASNTGLTFNAGTSTIVGNANTLDINTTGLTYYNVNFNRSGGGAYTIQNTNTFTNITVGDSSTLTLSSGITVTGTLSVNGTSPTIRSNLRSNTAGTQRTVNAAAASFSYTDFRDIAITGAAAPATGTSLGDCTNNSGITFTTPKTVYWNLAGAQNWSATGWATSSGGTPNAANFPLAQDTAVFDNAGSVTGTITINLSWNIGSIDMSARTTAMTLTSSGSPNIYGNWTNGSGTTIGAYGGIITFTGNATQQITSAGKTFNGQALVSKTGGALQLLDNTTFTTYFYHRGGTIDLNNLGLTVGAYLVDAAGTKVLAFGTTGFVKANGSTTVGGIPINISQSSGFSYTGTSNFILDNNTSNAITAVFQGMTEAQVMNLSVISGTYSFTDNFTSVKNLDFTGFAGTLVSSTSRTIYGNLVLSTGMTTGIPGTTTFAGTSGSETITCNGKTFAGAIAFSGVGSTWTLQDTLTTASTFTVTAGTLNTNNQAVTATTYSIAAAAIINLGSSVITATASGAAWTNAATTTFNAGTSEIVLSNNTTTARTFAGGSAAYNKVTIGGTTSTSTTTFTGNNYFAELASTKTVAHTLTFTASTTSSFGLWSITGTVGNVVTINSTSTTPAIFNAKATATLNYLAVTYNTGTPGNVWIAGVNSTLGTGVTGWALTAGTPRTLYWGPTAGTSLGVWNAVLVTNWYTDFARTTQALTAPTVIDDVVFDSASDNGIAFSVSVNAGAICKNLTISGLDNVMTLSGSSALEIGGSLSFPATNFIRTYSGVITFTAVTTGKTITLNGKSLPSIVFNGIGGEWTLQDAFTASDITVTAGSLVSNNQTITASGFISSTITPRAFTLGSSSITLSGSTTVNFSSFTNLNFNAGTSQITCTSISTAFGGGGRTFYNVTIGGQVSQSTTTITQDATFNNLTLLAGTTLNTYSLFNIYTSGVVVNGTLTATGASPTQRVFIKSNTINAQRTIKVAACSLTDVDFQDIVIDPTSATYPLTGTRLGNQLRNSGITFTSKTVYWNLAGTQNWTDNGWATTNNGTPNVNNFPLPQDIATFTEAGAAGTVTINGGFAIGSIQMSDGVSNRTTPFTLAVSLSFNIYGDVTLFSGLVMPFSALNYNWSFVASNYVQNFKCNGANFKCNILDIGAYTTSTGTFKILDDFNLDGSGSGGGLRLTAGTLDLNNYNLNIWAFLSSVANVRSILFSTGVINILQNATGTPWNVNSSSLTVTGTRTVNITNNTSSNISLSFANATQNNAVDFNVLGGTGAFTITGAGCRDLNFTGFAGTLFPGNFSVFGSLTLSTGMTYANTNTLTFASTTTGNTITSNGKQLTGFVTFNGDGGGWSLVDDFYLVGSGNTGAGAINGLLTFTAGTFTANNKNVTAFNVSLTGSNVRSITMGAGTWTLNGTNNVWDATNISNLTFNSTGSTIAVTSPLYLKKTFIGGGLTYGTLNLNTASNYVDLTLTGNNTFSTVSSTGPNKYLLTLPVGGVTTATNFSLNDSGAIKSSVNGVQTTILVSGGGTVSTTGVKYSDILISTSGTWTANSSVLFNTTNITAGANVAYGVLLTSGTTWTVPANWNASLPNFVYMFGGGGGGSGSALSGTAVTGGAGGGGGGFTLVQNYSTTASSSVTYSIGAGGLAGAAGGTSSTGGSGGNTTFASGTYSASGGSGGVVNAATPISTGGAGGAGTTYNGGTGGNGATNATTVNVGTGGGAGAGGLLGVGGNGGSTTTTAQLWGAAGGGNGGGSNGQGNVANPTGGNNIYSFGGGVASTGATSGANAIVVFVNSGVAGGGSSSTVNGYAGNGGNGIDVYDIFGGGGGAAGWANNSAPTSTGGLFGGGGGGGGRFGANQAGQAGGQGGIVIVYNIPAVTNNNNYMIMF